MDAFKRGRTASLLRILVLVLMALMCYQLGYNAGFNTGAWERDHMWRSASGTSPATVPADALD